MIGKTLGHYHIESLLGAGGMGEVYLARDTKLGRSVAIKVLPEAFAADADRISRFEREAKLLASMNHPNIAALHGMEESAGKHFLIMELVEGETLSERIRRGPIPVEETVTIALQIVAALEAAHEKGVVHRDLKPANVKITPEDKIKVLDFGLAKAMENAPVNSSLSNSPTLSMAATQAGVILGTAAYMSPEQAKGFQADARSDIFSFGCVLFEMLTGRQPFQGETSAEVLASILVREPEWSLLPANLNPRIPDLLRRCLAKNPRRRWQATGDLRAELETIIAEPRAAVALPQASQGRNYWKAASVLFFLGMAAFASLAVYLYRQEPDRHVVRFSVALPEKTSLAPGFTAAISPDGRYLAFGARDISGKAQLWLQPVDSLSAHVVPNMDSVGPYNFFWSPDSRSIAFWMLGKLKRVEVNGGGVQTICDSPVLVGGTWNSEGVILFASSYDGPIYRVQATGGQPAAMTRLENQSSHRFPHFLPDGRHFLYLATGSENGVFVGDLQSGTMKRLFNADTGAVYVDPGLVLFMRQGTLLSQKFDTRELETIGDPEPVVEPVAWVDGGSQTGHAGFSVSHNGILTYRIGSGAQSIDNVRLTWVDRAGKEVEQVGTPAPYRGVDLSPDGKRVVVHRHDGTGGDIWVFEPQRPTPLRLTFDASVENSSPIWSPDGKRVAFASHRGDQWGLYQKPSDGAGDEELLFQTKSMIMPMSWSPDNAFLVFTQGAIISQTDLWVLPLTGDKKPRPFLESRFNKQQAQISPDGKWISYNSTESGRPEVYVRPFPSGSGRWQVSTNGGLWSRWRADGKEIFYLTAVNNGKMMAVQVRTNGSTFEYGTAKELFDSQYLNYGHANGGPWHPYAVSRDGQRFFIPRPVEGASSDTSSAAVTVVLNWPSLLKR